VQTRSRSDGVDLEGLVVSAREDGICFAVRVAPRSSRDAILGVHDGALKVALTAPPVEGAANAALRKLLAKRFGVAKGAVQILHGDKSRDKTVLLRGVSSRA
tara:strand:- start:38 stop:343 length:306 start_codon:yes stop_codon:yes gene_type:complete